VHLPEAARGTLLDRQTNQLVAFHMAAIPFESFRSLLARGTVGLDLGAKPLMKQSEHALSEARFLDWTGS